MFINCNFLHSLTQNLSCIVKNNSHKTRKQGILISLKQGIFISLENKYIRYFYTLGDRIYVSHKIFFEIKHNIYLSRYRTIYLRICELSSMFFHLRLRLRHLYFLDWFYGCRPTLNKNETSVLSRLILWASSKINN